MTWQCFVSRRGGFDAEGSEEWKEYERQEVAGRGEGLMEVWMRFEAQGNGVEVRNRCFWNRGATAAFGEVPVSVARATNMIFRIFS